MSCLSTYSVIWSWAILASYKRNPTWVGEWVVCLLIWSWKILTLYRRIPHWVDGWFVSLLICPPHELVFVIELGQSSFLYRKLLLIWNKEWNFISPTPHPCVAKNANICLMLGRTKSYVMTLNWINCRLYGTSLKLLLLLQKRKGYKWIKLIAKKIPTGSGVWSIYPSKRME